MGLEPILQPLELAGFERTADLAGHARVHDDDVQAVDHLVVVVGEGLVFGAAEHGLVEALALVVVAEREQHRHRQLGLGDHRLEVAVAGGIATVGEITARHHEGRRRIHALHIGEDRPKIGRRIRIEVIVGNTGFADMKVRQVDEGEVAHARSFALTKAY